MDTNKLFIFRILNLLNKKKIVKTQSFIAFATDNSFINKNVI